MRRLTEPNNILDAISATDIYSALRHLQALSRLEAQQHPESSALDISFNQDRSHSNISQHKSRNPLKTVKAHRQPSMSFQLYQSKRFQDKGQKTARKKPQKQLESVKQLKVNPKSAMIIRQKECKGEKYTPIHLRTQVDLQKKRKNIQKLRSQLQTNKIDESIKQCTFKPKLNPASEQFISKLKQNNNKRIQNVHSHCSNQYKRQNKQNVLISSRQIQDALIDRKERNKAITPRKKQNIDKSKNRIKTQICDQIIYLNGMKAEQQKSKTKNKSFNILLDMIK